MRRLKDLLNPQKPKRGIDEAAIKARLKAYQKRIEHDGNG